MDNKPEAKFRAGTITATVWTNERQSKDGTPIAVSSVSFEKRYKDKDGTWKGTKSLFAQDLPRAIMVLTKAYEHVALHEHTEDDAVIMEEAA
jgi:hypothetical protein